jgi:hypothetical protein
VDPPGYHNDEPGETGIAPTNGCAQVDGAPADGLERAQPAERDPIGGPVLGPAPDGDEGASGALDVSGDLAEDVNSLVCSVTCDPYGVEEPSSGS